MLILSDEHHTVTSSTLSGPWKKKLVVQRSLFLWKVCGMFWCQKWSEVVWMDGRQSGVQKDRLGNFQWKNCSTELRLYTGFLRLLVASEVSEGGVWYVRAWELWRQVWLPTCGRRSLVSGTQNEIVVSWFTLWGMIKVYWLDLSLAYIFHHAVCCASAASPGRSLHLITSQLRTR